MIVEVYLFRNVPAVLNNYKYIPWSFNVTKEKTKINYFESRFGFNFNHILMIVMKRTPNYFLNVGDLKSF